MTCLDTRKQLTLDIKEAINDGARKEKACHLVGISIRTLQRWQKNPDGDKRPDADKTSSKALSKEEKQQIVDVCNTPEYCDLPPGQIVPILAEKGTYIASESSFYKILREKGQLNHRSKTKKPCKKNKPKEHLATGPGQVLSWDITYLRTKIKGSFFYLYLFLDIWSRKILDWTVEEKEDGKIASMVFRRLSPELDENYSVLHADNGSPMKSGTMLATLHNLGVATSFSRPSVSNDNAYSESLFKTLKYRVGYPKAFDTLDEAREWVTSFVRWYNYEHRHSAINYVTPDQRHSGIDKLILKKRKEVYKEAKRKRPERWVGGTRNWEYQPEVYLNKNTEKIKAKKIA